MTNIGVKHAFEHTPIGYDQFYHTLANNEVATARTKKTFLGLVTQANKLNGASPFQTNKLAAKDMDIFKSDAYLLDPSSIPGH